MDNEPEFRVFPSPVLQDEPSSIAGFSPTISSGPCWWAAGGSLFAGIFGLAGAVTLLDHALGLDLERAHRWLEVWLAVVIYAISVGAGISAFRYCSRRLRASAMSAEIARRAEAAQVAYGKRVADAEAEALQTERLANKIYASSREAVVAAAREIDVAMTHLRRAEKEYNARAYGPFWDAIEHTAQSLGAVSHNLRQVTDGAAKYEHLLAGRRHTFPSFPVAAGALPSPERVGVIFAETVRRAQTDFEFATIWEHRRTRDVLIAGFSSLGEAVDGLSDRVSGAYAEFCEIILLAGRRTS